MNALNESNNQEYHANRTHLSSSMLKLLLKDPERFYREWILGERNNEYNPAFVEGSLTHTICLEPEKINDYVVFPGARRFGRLYDQFAAANPDKTIVTSSQFEKAQKYAEACLTHETAKALLSGGFAEHTMTGIIDDIPVKARADYINIDKRYVVDIKTTKQPNDKDIFKGTCIDFGYDLSASLYLAIAEQSYSNRDTPPFDFYWIVISKEDFTCEVYKASSSTLISGSIKKLRAIELFKQCTASGQWTNVVQKPMLLDVTNYEIQEV